MSVTNSFQFQTDEESAAHSTQPMLYSHASTPKGHILIPSKWHSNCIWIERRSQPYKSVRLEIKYAPEIWTLPQRPDPNSNAPARRMRSQRKRHQFYWFTLISVTAKDCRLSLMFSACQFEHHQLTACNSIDCFCGCALLSIALGPLKHSLQLILFINIHWRMRKQFN